MRGVAMVPVGIDTDVVNEGAVLERCFHLPQRDILSSLQLHQVLLTVYTHTHTHARTHARTHTQTNTHVSLPPHHTRASQTHRHAHPTSLPHTHTHTPTPPRTHTHRHTHARTHAHAQTHARTHTRTH